jgi:hypothetical protein
VIHATPTDKEYDMAVSLRSYLTAGTAAVLGATAIAATPVLPEQLSAPAIPLVASPDVQLATFVEIIQGAFTGELLAQYLVNAGYSFQEGVGLDSGGAINWPFALTGAGSNILTAALAVGGLIPGAPSLGGYQAGGLIPQIIADGLPIASQVVANVADYASTSLGLIQSHGALGILEAGGYILNGVVSRAAAIISSVPQLVSGLAAVAIGGVQVLLTNIVQTVTNVVTGITSLDLWGAWKSLAAGIAGPSGIPGALLNLTIGAGVQTGPITVPADIATNFVPSIRTVVQQTVKTVAADLSITVPIPNCCPCAPVVPAATAPSAAKTRTAVTSAVPASPVVAAVEADRTVADAVEAGVTPTVARSADEDVTKAVPVAVSETAPLTDSAPPTVEKSVKHRAGRAAARAARASND